MKKGLVMLSFVLLTLCVFTQSAHAALSDLSIIVETSPKAPAPYETVNINLISYSTDIDSAFISWTKDGKVSFSGTGEKRYTFVMGGPGTKTSIGVSVRLGGESSSETFTFAPQDLDVIWEASDAYTPPFYKGKALPLREVTYSVVALPYTGSKVTPTGYIFEWLKNGDVQQTNSGYGKNTFSYQNNFLSKVDILKLTVRSNDGSFTVSKDITLAPEKSTSVLFYEKDPLLGVLYNKAIVSDFSLTKGEKTFIAEPYNFSGKKTSVEYVWKLNGNEVVSQDQPNELTISNQGGVKGVAKIDVSVNNVATYFQTLSKTLSINLE